MADSSACPRCGAVVHVPVKAWTMTPKKRNGAALRITMYECPRCLKRWRVISKLDIAAR